MRRNLKLSSDGGDFGSKKCRRCCDVSYGGGLAETALGASLQSEFFFFCWCVWKESGLSRREGLLTFHLLHKETLEGLYLPSDLQSYAALNCVDVQHTEVLFPSALTAHTALIAARGISQSVRICNGDVRFGLTVSCTQVVLVFSHLIMAEALKAFRLAARCLKAVRSPR
jgi:hypothetical protein